MRPLTGGTGLQAWPCMTKKLPTACLILCIAGLLAGCATSSNDSAGSSEPKVTVAEETYVPTGSHMRRRKSRPTTTPTTVMSGEDFSRQAKTDQIYPTGEQIINSRNGP